MKMETVKRLKQMMQQDQRPKDKAHPFWKMELREKDTLDLYVYSDVEADWYDWWSGKEIESDTSAKTFSKQLSEYPDVKQINVYISSNGGDVLEGTAIYSQLKRHSANVHVYVDSFACSVASVIAMAGDTITMAPNAMMMIHNCWTWAVGNASELRKQADDLDKIMEGNRQAYLLKAGDKLSEEKLIEMLDNETFLTAKECIELGLCDEIMDEDPNTNTDPEEDTIEQIAIRANEMRQKGSMLLQKKEDKKVDQQRKGWFF